MGKEAKPKANGNTGVKKKAEAVMDKKGEQPDGVIEIEEDKTSEKVQEDALKKEKSSKKRPRSKGNAETKENVQGKEPDEEKEQKSPTVKKTKGTSVQKEEPKTPSASTIERPVRARKSVERLVAAVEDDSAKELIIEKGRGTALKDIPNVAYKLSRKKTEETFKMLHSILFGRRGKAAQVKNNLSRFSGFVWHDDEEKQMTRIKEKLDKCNKEKLAEFCDVLDVSNTSNTRKEDIVAKLIEFLVEPHATTSDLLSEKEQGKKRKRSSKTSSASSAPSKGPVKSRKKAETTPKKGGKTKSTPPGSEDESGEEEDMNGVQERSDGEMSEQAASEDKGSESEEEPVETKTKQKKVSAKASLKKESSAKAKTKKVTKKASPPPKKVPAKSKESESGEETDKEKEKEKPSGKKVSSEKAKKTKNVTVSKKTCPPPKKVPAKSPSRSKSNDDSSAKKTLAKKKEEPVKKSSSPKSVKESPGKKVLKVKDKVKEETPMPTDYELNTSVCKLLKEVDFNTATFTDILNLLSKQYNMDLTPKKLAIKTMIQDELTRLADADEEDERDAEKDGKNAANKSVKV